MECLQNIIYQARWERLGRHEDRHTWLCQLEVLSGLSQKRFKRSSMTLEEFPSKNLMKYQSAKKVTKICKLHWTTEEVHAMADTWIRTKKQNLHNSRRHVLRINF